jgi:hypothetical protein
MVQARGRTRWIGQLLPVENFELSVENTFQDRIIHNTIMKSLPGAMAELTVNVQEVEDEGLDERTIDIGVWYLIHDELIQAPDPRVSHLHEEDRLSPEDFLAALMDSTRGKRMSNDVWEDEAKDDNTTSALDEINRSGQGPSLRKDALSENQGAPRDAGLEPPPKPKYGGIKLKLKPKKTRT